LRQAREGFLKLWLAREDEATFDPAKIDDPDLMSFNSRRGPLGHGFG